MKSEKLLLSFIPNADCEGLEPVHDLQIQRDGYAHSVVICCDSMLIPAHVDIVCNAWTERSVADHELNKWQVCHIQ